MGAIDPILTRNHAKFKSASIECNANKSDDGSPAQCDRFLDTDSRSISSSTEPMEEAENNSESKLKNNDSSFQNKAKKFLSLTQKSAGGSLKPSASTSCLFTASDDSNTSSAPVSNPTRASLTHEWKKLKTPNKCRECNLLVYFNGRECSFCGFVAHKKCVIVLVIKCSGQQVDSRSGGNKNRKKGENSQVEPLAIERDANRDLTAAQQQPVSRKSNKIPLQPIFGQPVDIDGRHVVDFVRRFIYEIDTRGLSSKGIYRVSSIKSKVDRLCTYYDQNLSSLVDLSSFHPNIIANALKMYLRQLPEPLLTYELYSNFIEIAKKYSNTTTTPSKTTKDNSTTKSETRHRKYLSPSLSAVVKDTSVTNNPAYDPMLIVELKEIIDLLPLINQRLIAIIMRHLKRVADMSDENQMSEKNLSIIFGPTLLSANNKSLAIVDNIHQARVIELMITWADQIFPQYENYESKAVIDLDLSEAESENSQMHLLNDVSGKKKSDNIAKDSDTSLSATGQHHDCQACQALKTRKDLKELRRQFFTVPDLQAKDDGRMSPLASPSVYGGYKARPVESKKAKPNNPPGSVPVIQVRPHYCKTLTKCEPSKP